MWGRKKEKAEKSEGISYYKACPRCGSRNVVMEPGISFYIILGWVYQYRCKDCNYFGPNIVLAKESEPPLRLDNQQ